MANGLPSLPRLPRTPGIRAEPSPSRPRVVPGIRGEGFTQESLQPYPDPPPGFRGPRTEWVCYWWLGTYKKYRQNDDWFFQKAVSALGVFTSRDFTRVDFLFPIGGDHPASAEAEYKALAWDPITPYTHPHAGLDKLKRAALAAGGVKLVWIDGATLEASPFDVLEKALRGIDISSRARGGG